jgi:hypothetical protein
MIMKASSGDQICRSLLQKAVRRGAVSVVEKTVISLIRTGELNWLKNRLGVVACEESWGNIGKLEFSVNESSLISQYKSLAGSSKNKNAAGLGSLAFELSRGVESVLVKGEADNKHINIVAEAIKRPGDFWCWVKTQKTDLSEIEFLNKSEVCFRLAGWPWDKAFAIASAYLFVRDEIPQVEVLPRIEVGTSSSLLDFPYWVAVDKHTSLGKRALAKCADKFNLDKTTLGWIQFYLESSKCERLQYSVWWEREKSWRLASEGVGGGKAEIIWGNVSDYLKEFLFPHVVSIEADLNRACALYSSTIKDQDSLI